MKVQTLFSPKVKDATLRSLIFWFLLTLSSDLLAYSQAKPAHHLFNTTILDPIEQQVSIVGNYKIGLHKDWEVGTQGVMTYGGTANLYLRHRMFDLGDVQTTFTSHLSYFSLGKL